MPGPRQYLNPIGGLLAILGFACVLASPDAAGQAVPLPPPGFDVDQTRSDPGRPTRPHGVYRGPIIDTHVHLRPPKKGSYSDEQLRSILDVVGQAGVSHIVFMPTPNEGRFRNSIESEPQLRRIRDLGYGRVSTSCGSTYLTAWLDEAADHGYFEDELTERLTRLQTAIAEGNCLGVGEIGPYHFEKYEGQLVIDFPFNFPPFLSLAGLAAESGVWLDLHAEPVTPSGQSYENQVFGGLALLYRWYPDLKLILAHTGMTNPRNARALLNRYPNLMMSVKVEPDHQKWRNLEPVTNEAGELYEDWAALIEEMPGRFLVGSDNHFGREGKLTRGYRQRIRLIRRVLGGLSAYTAAFVAYKNAERIWPSLEPDHSATPTQ